ncbi:MAG TPA: molecular chaperone TorD family protein [Anaeromyxobacteraceae bacterium]|nr:molecular chaperone TorD family protein [Anaeromyxobacteraceae bacterium]
MPRHAHPCSLLADVLSYPGAALAEDAAACAAALAPAHPAAAERLARFAAFAREVEPSVAEEAYTCAFDVSPLTSPYVGDQLFGPTRERALLLSGLRQLQRQAGVEGGAELPDHVCEVLRLLAAPLPQEIRDDLAREGLAPAARRMLAVLDEAHHPWADVLAAVVAVGEAREEATP